ncbi:MAG: acyl-ACP--UDP-N-acetylglucosamine O-acyltransferase [Xanthomonadaceae bacterium]|jgi:UDP-N-acetylglucosamine acyltransferase|nr:acyl-ACP--UDP-N-acetylglucosamine O-acyltransferase [Xanthomonadaceae bacterium]
MAGGIHPSAIIEPGAVLAPGVEVGPFSVIGAGVEIGAGTVVGPHVVIQGPTRIGRDNRIYQFASVGADPQDKKFAGEDTLLEIGDRNTIREFATINRGTVQDGGMTRIGHDNWIMAYVHIAHDCVVGNHCIFANAASLAGHVRIDDWAILGGFSLIHQFCQVGAHAFTSMGSVINRDVPPYVTVAGPFAEPKGINSEGLKRRGFDGERILSIKRAFKTLYKSGLPLAEARAQLAQAAQDAPDVRVLLDFIDRSERSLIR